jgi:hypothetical protein
LGFVNLNLGSGRDRTTVLKRPLRAVVGLATEKKVFWGMSRKKRVKI